MQLSNDTIAILKNFSQINDNLTITVGSKLSTVSSMRDVFATATIAEEFTTGFYLYSLSEFLSTLSLFEEPDLSFNNEFVRITDLKDSAMQTIYWSADPKYITKVPVLKSLPEATAEFVVTAINLRRISKAAGVLKVTDVIFEGKEGRITATVCDDSGAIKNNTTIELTNDYHGPEFSAKIAENKLRMIGGDYRCRVLGENMIYFVNTQKPVDYLFALAKRS